MSRLLRKEKRAKIVGQALEEITFARKYKQGKIAAWRLNEDLYYGKKLATTESRANVELGQMQSFIHTLLSKIDSPLEFKFEKRKNSQLKRVKQLNALKEYDANRDHWDMKDLVTKKQATLYGRAILFYSASSTKSYQPHLDPCDVYDFLIDPSAGGLDIDLAQYLGRYNIIKSEPDLKAGVKAGVYIKENVKTLLEGDGNTTSATEEDTNKRNRDYGSGSKTGDKAIGADGQFKFWEWFTTYEGERYYVLMTNDGEAIRVCPLKDVVESELWPVWSWAAFPDLTEFWTPSYADYVREVFMAQNVSINQLLDNAEKINKPQKIVNVSAIENLADLKYRKDGYIRVKNDVDIDKAFKTLVTPALKTPIDVYEILESIQEKNSGVTAAAKGVDDGDGKATIYEGNQANTADRFGLLNKSYSYGYKRFAKLWEKGVREHLKTKVAIEILGPDGLEIKTISRSDIFDSKDDSFGVKVESSSAELSLSILEKKTKLNFLQSQVNAQQINPQKSIEMQAKIAGFTEEEIRVLLQVDAYGTDETMAEADRDIELILKGEQIEPNASADTSYMQRFVTYIKDNGKDIKEDQFTALVHYLESIRETVTANMAQQLVKEKLKAASGQQEQGGQRNSLAKPKDVLDTTNAEQTINRITQV